MKCPKCESVRTKVIDSRPIEENKVIRRRRECEDCKGRFTTYERIENISIMVIKKDKVRESFDINKLKRGIIRSCEKRPVSLEKIESIAQEIENELNKNMIKEIDSKKIGDLVMERLKELDEVAYVRFASVYREFKDVDTFFDELEKMLIEKKKQDKV
ncbi:MAG: transcriptional regulator NrdR [Peptostreptococcaceae bacterium]|jgi:transcriptional repressor NrdR|nr:transcriptional regulator NrdR [Peptostreptococcaceae bacterium]